VLNCLIWTVLIWWIVSLFVSKSKPKVPRLLLWGACVLVLQASLMLLFRRGFDAGKTGTAYWVWFFFSVPASVNQHTTLQMAERQIGMLGVLMFVCDLARRQEWREKILWTIGCTGISLTAFGLVQRVADPPGMNGIFGIRDREGWTYFATYLYHANAAAFVNLILPIVIAWAVLAFRRDTSQGPKAFWLCGVIICAAGAFITASKAGAVLTILLLIALAIWQIRSFLAATGANHPRWVLPAAILAGLAALIAVTALSWQQQALRWGELPKAFGITGLNAVSLHKVQFIGGGARVLVYKACIEKLIPSAGLWGFGPGTFFETFSKYTGPDEFGIGIDGDSWTRSWPMAHQDYLQTIIEWGWIGGALWGSIVVGGVVVGFRNYLRECQAPSSDRALLFCSALALAGVAAHAFVDFPLQIGSIQLYAACLLGLCWASGNFVTAETIAKRRSSSSRR
jgi:hypothetical protein